MHESMSSESVNVMRKLQGKRGGGGAQSKIKFTLENIMCLVLFPFPLSMTLFPNVIIICAVHTKCHILSSCVHMLFQ